MDERAGGGDSEVETRRRVIHAAMTRRPTMTLGELHQVLRRLGVQVRTETLVADLDALGHGAEDGDRIGLATGDPVEDGDGARAPGRDRGGRAAAALAVLAVLVAGAAAVLAVVGLGGDGGEPRTATPARTQVTRSGPDGSTSTEPTSPTEPVVSLADADVALPFDVDGPLPTPGDAGPWDPGRGAWAAAGGVARASPPGAEEAVTFFAAPGPDLDVQITLPSASPGAGIAVRVRDDANYLAWVLTADGEGVHLVRVEAARQSVVAGPVEADLAPGATLGVALEGSEVALLVDGEVVATATDDATTGAVGVGLAAIGTDEVPEIDDLGVAFR